MSSYDDAMYITELRKKLKDTEELLEHCRHWSYSKAQVRQALEYLQWQQRKGYEFASGRRVLFLLGFEACPECKDKDLLPCTYCDDVGWVRTCEERKKDE